MPPASGANRKQPFGSTAAAILHVELAAEALRTARAFQSLTCAAASSLQRNRMLLIARHAAAAYGGVIFRQVICETC